jgi:hypothetical protein
LEVIEQGDEHKGIREELRKAAGYPREGDEEKRRIQPSPVFTMPPKLR